jgi:hypothetical protein
MELIVQAAVPHGRVVRRGGCRSCAGRTAWRGGARAAPKGLMWVRRMARDRLVRGRRAPRHTFRATPTRCDRSFALRPTNPSHLRCAPRQQTGARRPRPDRRCRRRTALAVYELVRNRARRAAAWNPHQPPRPDQPHVLPTPGGRTRHESQSRTICDGLLCLGAKAARSPSSLPPKGRTGTSIREAFGTTSTRRPPRVSHDDGIRTR